MLHTVKELEKAFNMNVSCEDDIEELRDMECYSYIAQYHEDMTGVFNLQQMRRRKFMEIVQSTIELGGKPFEVSEELTKVGTEWFKKQDFWESWETTEDIEEEERNKEYK